MAGDWIKMRADLHTHPKVVRMSSALNADRLRTIGGLHAVWCLFDAHSLDGTLDGYTLDALDSMIGWPGFSASMAAVGWLEVSGHYLELPRFDEHNSKGAKRRATETERKRMARAEVPDVRKLSASDADEKRSREEKSREEKKEEKARTRAAPVARPPDVDEQVWSDWLHLRKSKRAPVTQTTLNGAITEAEKAGMTLEAFLRVWCRRGSQGLEAAWLKPEEKPPVSPAASSIASADAELQRAREQAARAVPPPAAVLELAKRMRVG